MKLQITKLLPPAAKNLFEKRFLDFQKLFINKKLLWGVLNQWISRSVGQWVSSMIGKRSYESLIMIPRPHPETNENKHKRFAQHIGSPRRGAPGRRRQKRGK